MIVDDLHIQRIPILPSETDAPLVIDPDAILAFATALQCFQAIARRRTKFVQCSGRIDYQQFPARGPLDASKPPRQLIAKECLGIPVSEAADHNCNT
jgi:hypothetical protein